MRVSSKLTATALILGIVALSGCGSAQPDDASDTSDGVEKALSSTDPDPTDESTTADRAGGGGLGKASQATERKPSRSGRETPESNESEESPESSNGTDSAAPTMDAADLDAALLTVDDMPARWTAQPRNKDDDAGNVCGDDLEKAVKGLPKAEATYALDPDRGPQVAETIGLVGDRGRELMSLVEQTMSDCDGKRMGSLTISTSEESFADLGDESHAYRVQVEYSETGQTFDFGFSFVLADDAMLVLFAYDFKTGDDPFELLDEYAPIAVDRALAAAE